MDGLQRNVVVIYLKLISQNLIRQPEETPHPEEAVVFRTALIEADVLTA
jgi:hypothetical protein